MSTSPNEPRIPESLAADLRRVYRARVEVPGELDRTMLELAGRRAARPRRRIQPWTLVKWAGVAAAVVAAFIIPTHLSPTSQVRTGSPLLAHSGDVNGDGVVDILDAFALARAARDGDASISQQDIEAAATAAVRLTPVAGTGGGA
jgi:hypothetical protein